MVKLPTQYDFFSQEIFRIPGLGFFEYNSRKNLTFYKITDKRRRCVIWTEDMEENHIELTSLIVVGILSASVSFLLFIFCGVMSYKLWWKRDEYRKFIKESSSSREDNFTFVGWNPIYVPPCSTHRILQMSRDSTGDYHSSQRATANFTSSDHVVFLQTGQTQADETCDEFLYRGFG